MKIGDEIYVHGHVDEIRGDTVIIKNEGGYFGTCKKEVKAKDDVWDDWVMLKLPIEQYTVVVEDEYINIFANSKATVETSFTLKTDCTQR